MEEDKWQNDECIRCGFKEVPHISMDKKVSTWGGSTPCGGIKSYVPYSLVVPFLEDFRKKAEEAMPQQKEVKDGIYCGCDGECFADCPRSFNECRSQALAAIRGITS